MEMVKQYRLVIWGRDVTGWRFDGDAVRDEAIERGVASYDHRYVVGDAPVLFTDIGVRFQTREVPARSVIVKLEARERVG